MKNIVKLTFSELINERINEGMHNANRMIVNSLANKNVNVSMRAMQKYRKGERVPSFLIAKEILKIANVDISDSDLSEILENSRNELKEEKPETQNVGFDRKEVEKKANNKRKIVVNLDELNLDVDMELKNQILDDRVVQLYGDESEINKYVQALIEKDLAEEILK